MSTFTPASLSLRPRGLARGWRRAWGGALLLVGLSACPLHAKVSKEYQLKAAFLFNFTKFVEWPAERFADEKSPIVIGVLGRNPFEDELAKIVQGRMVNGREIAIRIVTTPAEVRAVHLLFVPAGEETHVPAAAWQDVPLVAVGESAAFSALGGAITFTQQGDKLRFVINLELANRTGLKISAQLLKLALSVRRKS